MSSLRIDFDYHSLTIYVGEDTFVEYDTNGTSYYVNGNCVEFHKATGNEKEAQDMTMGDIMILVEKLESLP